MHVSRVHQSENLRLKSFLKSTGGKGLHLVAPIAPKLPWEEVKAFCKGIADALGAARPDRYTSNPAAVIGGRCLPK